MNYRLGTAAKIIGTSKEAIRFFEKKDCINEPKRDDSGYRVYDPLQLSILRWFRLYRSLGFSMQDAANLVKTIDDDERINLLYKGVVQLQQQRVQLERCEEELRALIRDIREQETNKPRFVLESCPTLYRISYESDEKLHISGKNSSALAEWTEKMPFVKYTVVFHTKDIETAKALGSEACIPMDYGMGIFENEIFDWNPQEHGIVETYPKHRYLTTWITSPVTYSKISAVFDYMNMHGLIQDGEIFSRSSMFKRDAATSMPLITCKFYIPIK